MKSYKIRTVVYYEDNGKLRCRELDKELIGSDWGELRLDLAELIDTVYKENGVESVTFNVRVNY